MVLLPGKSNKVTLCVLSKIHACQRLDLNVHDEMFPVNIQTLSPFVSSNPAQGEVFSKQLYEQVCQMFLLKKNQLLYILSLNTCIWTKITFLNHFFLYNVHKS